MFLGERIHARPGGEVIGRLGAAMQHDDYCGPFIAAVGGNVKPIFARAGSIGVGRCRE